MRRLRGREQAVAALAAEGREARARARPEDLAAGERVALRDALSAIDPETRAGVGLAHCVRHRDDPSVATAAVIVVDEWQNRGLGTRLLKRLADRARAAGIECFESHMIVGDTTARQVFESVGAVETAKRSAGVVDFTVRLAG